MPRAGGLDLGGTKIEASLFGPDWDVLATRRRPTPTESYAALLDALAEEVAWLRDQARPGLPVGLGMPGPIVPRQERFIAVQLPLAGERLAADLAAATAGPVPVENDANCFALSEAVAGAARGAETVFGLILGTGVGGGLVAGGAVLHGRQGYAGEIGHTGVPADVLSALGLPVFSCGCGRRGCFETCLSGPGLSRLARHLAELDLPPQEVTARAAAGDPACLRVLEVWSAIAARLIETLQMAYDPDCIVLGGGLSRMPGLLEQLRAALPDPPHYGQMAAELRLAEGGDSSGTRGAAIMAEART
ncbi:MAG: ROK family protein [Rhodobacteraceae bacterium]|nr:ROK family protein [Paracoccaceae bacterium]